MVTIFYYLASLSQQPPIPLPSVHGPWMGAPAVPTSPPSLDPVSLNPVLPFSCHPHPSLDPEPGTSRISLPVFVSKSESGWMSNLAAYEHVCVSVCTCVSVCVCTSVLVCQCVHACIHACMCVHTCPCVHVHTYPHVNAACLHCVHVYGCTRAGHFLGGTPCSFSPAAQPGNQGLASACD